MKPVGPISKTAIPAIVAATAVIAMSAITTSFAVGCSSPSASNSEAVPQPPGVDTGVTTVDDVGIPESDGAQPSTNKQGRVRITNDPTYPATFVNAFFSAEGSDFDCTQSPADKCVVSTCTSKKSSPASAGKINVTIGDRSLHLVPQSNGTYKDLLLESSSWSAGEKVTIAVAGASVPAFTDSLIAPMNLEISAPSIPDGTWTLDRGVDLELRWSPVSSDVFVYLSTDVTADVSTEVDCTFAGDAGAATIPKAMLAKLPAGTGSYIVQTLLAKTIVVDGWSIRLRLATDGAGQGHTLVGTAQFK